MKVLIAMMSLVVMAAAGKDCHQVTREFNECTQRAHRKYKESMRAGQDGRDDFAARKACNYLEEGVESCGNTLIGECNTEEKVTEMKDNQITSILEKLMSSIQAWDSNKCPAVKASIDRMKAAEEAKLKTAAQQEANPSSGGLGLLPPGLLLLAISLFL